MQLPVTDPGHVSVPKPTEIQDIIKDIIQQVLRQKNQAETELEPPCWLAFVYQKVLCVVQESGHQGSSLAMGLCILHC